MVPDINIRRASLRPSSLITADKDEGIDDSRRPNLEL